MPIAAHGRTISLWALVVLVAGCGGNGAGGDAIQVPWQHARPQPGGRALEIGYVNDPCTRARGARVEEAEQSVTVTLLDPERDPERACIQLAQPGCVIVRLSERLGDRKVIDGADPTRRERPGGRGSPFGRFGPCKPVPVD